MSRLEQQVRTAQKRLTSNLFFERLAITVLLSGGAWCTAILVVRLLGSDLILWHGAWITPVLAMLIAVFWTVAQRPAPLVAALTLDRAAGTKERLSTAFELLRLRSADDFARAAVADAERTAAKLSVPAHIRRVPPPLWPWSAAVLVAGLILAQFLPAFDLFGQQAAAAEQTDATLVRQERESISNLLTEQLGRMQERAEENPHLRDLVNQIEPLELPDHPGQTPEDVRREAVKKIDEIGAKLEQELAQARDNPANDLKRMLAQLNTAGSSQQKKSELEQALAAGDLQQARNELERMKEEMQEAAKNAEDPAAQQRLDQLAQQLEELARRLENMDTALHLQKELENRAGLSAEEAQKLLEEAAKADPKELEKALQQQLGDKLSAEQLQQIAKKIQQNQQAQKQLQQLAQQLSQASQACQQCQGGGESGQNAAQQGGNALGQAMGMLSDLELSEQLMNELSAQLSDLDQMRNRISQGEQGRNPLQRPSDAEMGSIGEQGPNEGLGYGERIGKETVPYRSDPTKAQTRFDSGTVIGQLLFDGPQVAGEARAEVLGAAASDVRVGLDAIERQSIPRQYHAALRTYFERYAGLVAERGGTLDLPPPPNSESGTNDSSPRD